MAVGRPSDQPFAAFATPTQAGHRRVRSGLVDEDDFVRIKRGLIALPDFAGQSHVGTQLLGCVRLFFKANAAQIEKPPKRGDAGRNPAFAHQTPHLFERDVRLPANQRQKPIGMIDQWRPPVTPHRAARATARHSPALNPFNRRGRTDKENASRLARRGSAANRSNDTLTQIDRVGLGHGESPQITQRRIAHSNRFGNPPPRHPDSEQSKNACLMTFRAAGATRNRWERWHPLDSGEGRIGKTRTVRRVALELDRPRLFLWPERIPGGEPRMTSRGAEKMQNDTIGVDISKDHLDVHRLADGASRRFANDKRGHKALIKWLAETPVNRVVFEPTGPYHRAFERALGAAGVPFAKVNPRQARRFAEATGKLAKTDPLDA